MNAVSLNAVGSNSLALIGPVLAGFLIDSAGYTIVYGIICGVYVLLSS